MISTDSPDGTVSTVGVVVPAANEQEHVGACLDALGVARAHLLRISGNAVEAVISTGGLGSPRPTCPQYAAANSTTSLTCTDCPAAGPKVIASGSGPLAVNSSA